VSAGRPRGRGGDPTPYSASHLVIRMSSRRPAHNDDVSSHASRNAYHHLANGFGPATERL
jgi:hypothetical protein